MYIYYIFIRPLPYAWARSWLGPACHSHRQCYSECTCAYVLTDELLNMDYKVCGYGIWIDFAKLYSKRFAPVCIPASNTQECYSHPPKAWTPDCAVRFLLLLPSFGRRIRLSEVFSSNYECE